MEDRRRSPRYPITLNCWCDAGGSSAYIPMVNLSERGAFLKTALPFSVGRRMYLGWNLPGAVMVRTEATVVWTTNGGPSLPVPGMGVQFVDVVEGGEFLEKYLKERNTAGE